MRKRSATREASETVQLRVALPFLHRGARVFAGDIIECTAAEAEGALFLGWVVPLINGDGAGRHNRRDMRAK